MDDHHKYWLGRWKRGETGWHQDEVEPELVDYFGSVSPARVFVPLCGKSLDLKWLADQGHEVVGIELSENACREFFKEHRIRPAISKLGNFTVLTSDRIKIYAGDFFKLDAKTLGPIDHVYDRAALVALSPDLRAKYTAHLTGLIRECSDIAKFRALQLSFERIPHDLKGPPYSVTEENLRSYYETGFEISCLKQEEVEIVDGVVKAIQKVYELKREV